MYKASGTQHKLQRPCTAGSGPVYFKLGGRAAYRVADIEQFEGANIQNASSSWSISTLRKLQPNVNEDDGGKYLTLYGIRHCFKDRLRAVHAPDGTWNKTIAGELPVDNVQHARLDGSAMLPFDASATIARMMLDVAHLARSKGEPYRRERHIGPALELMYVMMTVLVATRDGKPIHATELAKRLDMPRTNVRRHLTTLVASGRVAIVGQAYVATDHVNNDPAMQAMLRETVRIIVGAAQDLGGFL